MEIITTAIEDLLIIQPKVYGDERGYFFESYNQKSLRDQEINLQFIQDNEALSGKFTFRGFHYQLPPYGQAKLVRVIRGSVLDLVIDIRPRSTTYGEIFSLVLSAQNKTQLLVPEGFAHGYLSLEENTIFSYKVNQYYHKQSEAGISFLDPALEIVWPADPTTFIISEKDKYLPKFGNHRSYE